LFLLFVEKESRSQKEESTGDGKGRARARGIKKGKACRRGKDRDESFQKGKSLKEGQNTYCNHSKTVTLGRPPGTKYNPASAHAGSTRRGRNTK